MEALILARYRKHRSQHRRSLILIGVGACIGLMILLYRDWLVFRNMTFVSSPMRSFPKTAQGRLDPNATVSLLNVTSKRRQGSGPIGDGLQSPVVQTAFGDYPKGCFLSDTLDVPGLPIIHSIFADPWEESVVMVGVLRSAREYPWHRETFRCEFPEPFVTFGGSDRGNSAPGTFYSYSDPVIQDNVRFGTEPQNVQIITCPLPRALINVTRFTMNVHRVSLPNLGYDNLTVCPSSTPGVHKPTFLAMCTMLKNMDNLVPTWLEYHRGLGVERVIIYDNAVNSTLPQAVRSYLDSGFLTIIPWAHRHSPSKTYLEVQIASENDCVWRLRPTTKWLIKIDVDEFLQPLDYRKPLIRDYLTDTRFNRLGSLRVQNVFFCPSKGQRRRQDQGLNVIERDLRRSRGPSPVNMGRDKAILQLKNVHYFKIHGIKLGGDTLTLSPWAEMRLSHYRGSNPRHPGYCSKRTVPDDTMLKIWRNLTKVV